MDTENYSNSKTSTSMSDEEMALVRWNLTSVLGNLNAGDVIDV